VSSRPWAKLKLYFDCIFWNSPNYVLVFCRTRVFHFDAPRPIFFSVRICSVWNSVPNSLVYRRTSFAFRTELFNVNLCKVFIQNIDYGN